MAQRFAAEQPRGLVLADVNLPAVEAVAEEVGGLAVQADVSREADIRKLVDSAREFAGPIDLFYSNAGIGGPAGGPEAPDDELQRTWEINVMAHIWAARAVLPEMVERGEGYLLSTASAAGLLTQVSALAYSITKHAAVAAAEWIAITYGDAGIKVSCLCPLGVRTPMLEMALDDQVGAAALLADEVLEPSDVAEAVVAGIRDERFLILPHEIVGKYVALKGADHERWLTGMRRLVRARAARPSSRGGQPAAAAASEPGEAAELARVDWLGHVGVAPCLERSVSISLHSAGGAREDRTVRRARIGLDLAREPEPVAVGQVEIEHDQLGDLLGDRAFGRAQRAHAGDVVTVELEHALEQLEVQIVVVDDEDPARRRARHLAANPDRASSRLSGMSSTSSGTVSTGSRA